MDATVHYATTDSDGRCTGLISFGQIPDPRDVPAGAFLIDADTLAEWEANFSTRKWDYSARALVACDAPVDLTPYDVPALLVVDRLGDAGKLRAALLALKMDAASADLSDDELLLRNRWVKAAVLSSADSQVRGLLTAIGADPDAILARP